MGAVVTGQVGIGFGVAEIVHSNDLDFASALGLEQRTQHVAADAAIAIDTDTYGHD